MRTNLTNLVIIVTLATVLGAIALFIYGALGQVELNREWCESVGGVHIRSSDNTEICIEGDAVIDVFRS